MLANSDKVKLITSYDFSQASRWLSEKEFTCNEENVCSAPGLGRSLGEENDNPFQYSSLGNPKDRGAWKVQSIGSQKTGVSLRD